MAVADVSEASIVELISLKGKNAVITGGARGIGLAIGRRLAEAGANIVIADIDVGGRLQAAVKELSGMGVKAFGFPLDTRDSDDMERAAQEAEERLGGVDIWVNDAGIYPTQAFLEIEEAMLDEVIGINIKGVMNGARSAGLRMQRKGGVILNLASVSGFVGTAEMAHYNASKFAVRGLTAALAKEWGGKNIRVVAIAPTLVDTPGAHEQIENFEKEAEKQKKDIPLGRISVPDDIARIALVLVSDLAAYVTGTTFVVDGGNLALG